MARPYWTPPRFWEGETVYIIGGGPSFKAMDPSLLFGRCTIGINDAYRLGNWVKLVFFGDKGWLQLHNFDWITIGDQKVPGFKKYKGLKVCCNDFGFTDPNIHVLRRRSFGLHLEPGYVGFNGNSGSAAINLAISVGASRVVLLGFDMKSADDGTPNWHPKLKDHDVSPQKYRKFIRGMKIIANDAKRLCPNVEIVNATPGSALTVFPMVNLEDVL